MDTKVHTRELGKKLEDTAQKSREAFAEEYAQMQTTLEPVEPADWPENFQE